MFDRIIDIINNNNTFIITSHMYPDGDSIGSQLSLGMILKNLGKKVDIMSSQPIPDVYYFLPGIEMVKIKNDEISSEYDVGFVLDSQDPDRTGNVIRKNKIKILINIDHHIDNSRFAEINLIDSEASATAEIIYDLILKLNKSITREVAENLYTAILTDTGSFRYSNTSPKSMRIAASLIENGVDPAKIASNIFETYKFEEIMLISEIIKQIKVNRQKDIAWISLGKDFDNRKFSYAGIESEDIIRYPRSIRGIKVAVLFREMGNGEIKVSFRSKGKINVSEIASYFGGGGHLNAAGCTIKKRLNDAEELIISEIEKIVRSSE